MVLIELGFCTNVAKNLGFALIELLLRLFTSRSQVFSFIYSHTCKVILDACWSD